MKHFDNTLNYCMDSHVCLHEWFELQAAATPDAIAVSYAGQTWTYGELNRRANTMAYQLIERGVQVGDIVALCLERNGDLIPSLIGILKAGAAYAPIDPTYPTERLQFIIRDCAATAIVSTASLAEKLALKPEQVVDVDHHMVAHESDDNPRPGVTPDRLAYVIYTSGSTGVPKGVLVSHANVTRLFTATQPWFQFSPRDTWTMFHSFAFDFSVWEIWGALLYGGHVIVVPYAVSRSPAAFYRLLSEHRVTVLNQTPSAFRQLMREDERLHGDWPLALRTVVFGGEALEFSSLRPWVERHGDRVPKLINMYGITETTVHVTYREVTAEDIREETSSLVGVPIPDLQLYILDAAQQPVEQGVVGEIYVGGAGVSQGYLNRPELSAERFIANPFSPGGEGRLYRTGDLGRLRPDGELEYHGRSDRQVQLRGFRVELGEIESRLQQHASVGQAIVITRADDQGVQQLMAYIVPAMGHEVNAAELRHHATETLPDYMIPQFFVALDDIPLTDNGKLDTEALPAPQIAAGLDDVLPATPLEAQLAEIWAELLGVERVRVDATFFELGGQSLMLAEMERRLDALFPGKFAIVDLFQHPTIVKLAAHLARDEAAASGLQQAASSMLEAQPRIDLNEPIAIIGMAGRFPGASTVDEFWENLKQGVESIRRVSESELLAAGFPAAFYQNSRYVPATASIDDIDWFDAEFFGISPQEATITDPQHRLFLECAWSALEHAGYDPQQTDRRIGVYAGARPNSYRELVHRTYGDVAPSMAFQTLISNEKDFLATRVSHRLDLCGPSMTIQTGCSTALVAVQLAMQALQTRQCSMALAGGVSVNLEHRYGYLSEEGMILSPDGHVRTFDEAAAGTVFGEGVAIVVLKRLSDAIEHGDTIHAVIKAVALNNDGAAKVSFAAPSIDGQADVVTLAQQLAQVSAESIGYLEAHGTGTYVGDPVEIAALTRAFRQRTDRTQYCAIGSVKTNVGHHDVAAGVTGLIKAVLCVRDGVIVPSLHFQSPNRQANFASSPFYVASHLQDWSVSEYAPWPRRAGVSSFGIGGTNAHAIVEAPPRQGQADAPLTPQLLVLSARDQAALDQMTENLAHHLQTHAEINLANVAYTLQRGRRAFRHRRALVAHSVEDAVTRLSNPRSPGVARGACDSRDDRANVVFMFPGQGSQYINMARGLYQAVPTFRADIDACSELAAPSLGVDLREVMFKEEAAPGQREADQARLTETWLAQPAIFTIEYALARWWFHWGVRPAALVGHSIGEYAAACLAGVFSLDTAMALTILRGRLLHSLPRGAMLAVSLPRHELESILPSTLAVAAVNSPASCVVAGAIESVQGWAQELVANNIAHRPLHTSHAFHSPMTEPILEAFTAAVEQYPLSEPNLPMVSTVTGHWVEAGEMSSAQYWAHNIRRAVQFSDAAGTLLKAGQRYFLEVGPGQTLSSLVRAQPTFDGLVVRSTRHPQEQTDDAVHITQSLGQLWAAGGHVDWNAQRPLDARRVPLPSYPFQRKRFWVNASAPGAYADVTPTAPAQADTAVPRLMNGELAAALPQEHNDFSDWFYVEDWQSKGLEEVSDLGSMSGNWLILTQPEQLRWLAEQLASVVVVQPGAGYARREAGDLTINPDEPSDYDRLFAELLAGGMFPARIVHAWKWGRKEEGRTPVTVLEHLDAEQKLGLYSLQYLIQALGRLRLPHPVRVDVISDQVFAVMANESVYPEHATLIGACKVIPLEYPDVHCRLLDIPVGDEASLQQELGADTQDPLVAYRDGKRFIPGVKPRPLDEACENLAHLKSGGTYLITGGLGGIGHAVARFLARTVQANLVLVGRRPLTEQDSQRMSRLRELESLGARVLYVAADVAELASMRQVIAQAVAEFGPIDGVVHSAGVADSAGAIQLRTREMTEEMLRSKVRGTLVLEAVLAGQPLDFWALFSSISNVLYHNRYGQLSYVAGNSFLEAFAARLRHRGQFAVAIAWDEWQDVGMAAEVAADFAASFGKQQQLFDPLDSFSPQDGERAFHRALASDVATVMISTRDLRLRIRLDVHAKSPFLEAAREMAVASNAGVASPSNQDMASLSGKQQIAQMWQRILGVADIGHDDNYFALGGDSLSAVRFLAEVNREFGEQVPFAAMVEFPTPAMFAEYLELDKKQLSPPKALPTVPVRHTPVVEFSSTGGLPPLFLIHAADGYTLLYNELVDRFDSELPVYGLPSPALYGASLESIESLAAQHVATIRRVRPKGPYLIAGYCMGGTVALDVAQQLRAEGEDVPLLIGIETYNWKYSLAANRARRVQAYYYWQKLDFHFRNFLMLSLQQQRKFVGEKLKVATRRRQVWMSNMLRGRQQATDASGQLDPGQIWRRHDEIAEAYEPQLYTGKFVMFRAQKDYVRYMGTELPVKDGLEMHRLPVYPAGMLAAPFVDRLATDMMRCIHKHVEQDETS
ncbi:MAG: hypothetical protein ETSY1_05325 [Candidatus Entotheonella factor]|uniref:Carrier domain-containing protein n=1 Tax=Entotheonella factor TaxID=1429438 RepID=W4LVP7_ENTF1|nr:MAG: hypothetical protein ETSY1_05325 [Candidatus Entotheonella factor]